MAPKWKKGVATVNAVASKVKSKADLKRMLPQATEAAGNCPNCNIVHMYKRSFLFGLDDFPSVRLDSCPKFQALSVKENWLQMERLKGCKLFTSWKHEFKACPSKGYQKCKHKDSSGTECGALNSTSLHNSGVVYCALAGKRTPAEGTQTRLESCVLLEIQEIEVHGKNIAVLFDNGLSATLDTHKFAKEVGLKGEKVTYYLKVVGQGYVEKQTMMYDLEMRDNTNQVHKVRALGIETITEEMTEICLDGVKNVIP